MNFMAVIGTDARLVTRTEQNRTEQKNIPDCMGVKWKACTFLLNSVEELKKGSGDIFCSIMESMWLLSMSLDKPTSFREL